MDATVVEAIMICAGGLILAVANGAWRRRNGNGLASHSEIAVLQQNVTGLQQEVQRLSREVRTVLDALLAARIITPERYPCHDD